MINYVKEEDHPDGLASWYGASFGPVVQDGYGACYRFVAEHAIHVHVSARHESRVGA